MSDIVIHLPPDLNIKQWLGGRPAFPIHDMRPPIRPGERLYFAYRARLVGYAKLEAIKQLGVFHYQLIGEAGFTYVTVRDYLFYTRAYVKRFWEYKTELKTEGVLPPPPLPEWLQEYLEDEAQKV